MERKKNHYKKKNKTQKNKKKNKERSKKDQKEKIMALNKKQKKFIKWKVKELDNIEKVKSFYSQNCTVDNFANETAIKLFNQKNIVK